MISKTNAFISSPLFCALVVALGASPAHAQLSRELRPVTLVEALVMAARQSPDVLAARAQAQVAKESTGRAYSAWLPELTAQGSYVYTSAPAFLDLGGFVELVGQVYRLPAGAPVVPPPVSIIGRHSRYGTVQLSQPLFTPQGLFLMAPAKAGAAAADFAAQEAREQVLLNVARAFLGVRGIAQMMEAAKEAEAVGVKRESDARARLEVGTAVEVTLLRAQTETAQARGQLALLEGQRVTLISSLEALVGEAITPRLDEDAEAALKQAALDIASPEEESPWERTFAVQSAVKQVESAEGTVRFDRYAWLPSVAAVGRGNYNSNAGFAGKNLSYDVTVAVNLPLYDRGLRRVTRREDEAKLAQARANLQGQRARARATWQAGRANIDAAKAALEQAEAQAQAAHRAQEQVTASAHAGVATNLEQSDADSQSFAAKSSAAQARAQLSIRRAELAAAEGRLSAYVNRIQP